VGTLEAGAVSDQDFNGWTQAKTGSNPTAIPVASIFMLSIRRWSLWIEKLIPMPAAEYQGPTRPRSYDIDSL